MKRRDFLASGAGVAAAATALAAPAIARALMILQGIAAVLGPDKDARP